MPVLIMKKYTIIILMIFTASLLFADSPAVAPASLSLHGTVGSRFIMDITQIIGAIPGYETAIPLDSGDVLKNAPGNGVQVGTWSVSSNSSASLSLRIGYEPFSAPAKEETIPYEVYNSENGEEPIENEGLFATLTRVNGIYPPELNTGPIFIKRTDTETYPPGSDYMTAITFTLSSD